ncbi:MAG: hypothetical protein NZ922_00615 [Candidatus Methanomethyliaceae archaeon]|nr:hypothetical protein [Candidatus Methanomethyliaceae archaeon]MDW7970424.1 PhoU domain-containing protein [Nitrososphaerota archaeon]
MGVSIEEYEDKINSTIMEMTELIENIKDHVLHLLRDKKKGLLPLATELCKVAQIKEEKVMEFCIEALIRLQPFASDLRKLTTSMKVAYDISRICRYLRNILEVAEEFDISKCDTSEVLSLFENALSMIISSIRSYLQKDFETSRNVIKADELIDQKYRKILRKLASEDVEHTCILFNGLAARIIERMADHACYIANETAYLLTGNRTL